MMLSEKRARREARERAADLVRSLQGALADAYGRFNRAADPALLEASILEIGALRARCDAALRAAKALENEIPGGSSYDHRNHTAARRRGRAHRAAGEAAQKADQVGV